MTTCPRRSERGVYRELRTDTPFVTWSVVTTVPGTRPLDCYLYLGPQNLGAGYKEFRTGTNPERGWVWLSFLEPWDLDGCRRRSGRVRWYSSSLLPAGTRGRTSRTGVEGGILCLLGPESSVVLGVPSGICGNLIERKVPFGSESRSY